jgi:hypothetical protein
VKKLAGEIVALTKEDPRVKKLAGEIGDLSKEDPQVKKLSGQIAALSKQEPYKWVEVAKGTRLKMPEGKPDFEVAADNMKLKDVAKEVFGRERKAAKIFDRNQQEPTAAEKEKGYVKLVQPQKLPKGAELSLPSPDWPAWVGFLVLAIFLLFVGTGRLLAPAREQANGNGDG